MVVEATKQETLKEIKTTNERNKDRIKSVALLKINVWKEEELVKKLLKNAMEI